MATVEDARTERRPFIRPDGKDKVTGLGRYTADMTLTGMLYARFVYAPTTHARLVRVDTAKARALPGVFAVITHADVPDVLHGPFVPDRRLFAKDVVRFEGDVVAAVAALTPEIADAAVALVEIELEELPAVSDPEVALEAGAALLHPGWEAYEAAEDIVRSGNSASRSTIVKGDADAAIAEAEVVVRGRYVADMSHAAPIEPHAVIAQWEGDHVTIWSSTQVPFPARSTVAHTLQLPESSVRVIVPLLGGGFGGKCEAHFEAHVAALARAARRPVKLVFSRREEFTVPDHRREGMAIELETAVSRDGTLLARRGKLVIDNGAYTADAAFFPQLAAMHAVGPYRVPHISVEADLVYTNNAPSGSVRAPTAPQVCWALEQHLDAVAREIGMDPVELRRRNIVHEGDEGPTRQIFNPIGASETLERACELIGYGRELPADEAIGVACGWWPSFTQASGAFVKLESDGSGTIITGAMECGSGAVMALPILVAEVLGMQPEQFSILSQDTAAGGFDGGASGSQTTFNNGKAVIEAAGQIRDQLLDLGSEALEADRGDLVLADGSVQVVGSPERNVSISELAATAHGGKLLLGRGSSTPGRRAGLRRRRVCRPHGHGVVPRAHLHHARAALPRRSRDRCRAGARGRRGARLRADPEPDRRRGPGRGGRRDGHRRGPAGGHRAERRGPSAEPGPARLQAADVLGRTSDHDRVRHGARPLGRWAAGLEGRRRATLRADARRGRERHREGDRLARHAAPDDAGSRVVDRAAGWTHERVPRARVARRCAPRRRGGCTSDRRAAPTSWSAPGTARRRFPSRSARSIACASSPASVPTATGASSSAPSRATRRLPPIPRSAPASRASRTPRRSSARTRRATPGRSAATS